MYETDPDRLNRPRVGDPVRDPAVEGGVMPAFLTAALFAAAVIAFALFLWPSDRAPTVTQTTPQVQRDTTGTQPVKPPANTQPPATTPAPPQ